MTNELANNQMKSVKNIFKILLVVCVITLATYIYSSINEDNTVKDLRAAPRDNRVCRDIFEIGRRSKNMSSMIDLAVKLIKRKREKKLFMPQVFYEIVGYESPSMIRKVTDGSGLQHTNFTISKTWRFQQTQGQLPHLACRMREMQAEDLRMCVARRHESVGSTHIAYVGDSRIRQHLEVLLDLIRSLQPRITTHLGEVITVETFLGEEGLKNWRKYKHNFRVECSQAPGLIVDFHWAAFIDRGQTPRNEGDVMVGALDLLHRWIKAPQDQIPDIIVLSNKGHFTQQENDILEWLLNAQMELQPSGVVIWDSFLPVAYASRSDCMHLYDKNIELNSLPTFSTFSSQISWHCVERMHVGLEALSVAVQMVLNHVCNPYMTGDYCCSKFN
nr:uncharacterized protein LOC128695433 isoform X2 [Cherax quadricarinatus]